MMKENSCNCTNNNFKNGSFEEIFELIFKIGRKFEKIQRPLIRKFELTLPQYYILEQLHIHNKLQFKNLADACYCSRSTITGVVDTMEKKGLVSRVANPNDRRSLFVKLTHKGETLFQSIPSKEKYALECCISFKPEEIQQLSLLLKKLFKTLIYNKLG